MNYRHLGCYSDLVAACRPLYPRARPGKETQRRLREILAFAPGAETPRHVQHGRRWIRDGVAGEEISWSVGYGPRTEAWALRPAGVTGRLPGVLALHDHGGYKFYGKEKIADGPSAPTQTIREFRELCYGGRAFANALARAGYVVLVHDVAPWGSRRFPLAAIPEFDRQIGRLCARQLPAQTWQPPAIATYNQSAIFHEHTLAKYCAVLGVSLPGLIAFEDRVAANYLASRPDVQRGQVGCVGLSGGGMRSVLLQATCDRIGAAVVVGAMCSYTHLLDHNVVCHTWLFFPPGWSRHGDWPDIAACRAPSPLLVQNGRQDALYTLAGMRSADRRIAAHYRDAGKSDHYKCQWYTGPHRFDVPMQRAAFAWLARWLK